MNKVDAATSPPLNVASGPTIAFCTALLISKINTRSTTDSCASSFFPNKRMAITINRYTVRVLTIM